MLFRSNNPAIADISDANFSIVGPTISVTSPSGGESWVIGSIHNITWTSTNLTGNVNVEVNGNYPTGAWDPLFMNTTNDGSQSWTIATDAVAGTAKRIRVTSVDNPSVFGISTSNFTLTALPLGITVTLPNGGESWVIGSTYNITWTSLNLTGNVNVEINGNYPSGTWEILAPSTANDGLHSYTVTGTVGPAKRVRVTSVNNPAITDIGRAHV